MKNKNIIFKFRRSKVTDYAALSQNPLQYEVIDGLEHIPETSMMKVNN